MRLPTRATLAPQAGLVGLGLIGAVALVALGRLVGLAALGRLLGPPSRARPAGLVGRSLAGRGPAGGVSAVGAWVAWPVVHSMLLSPSSRWKDARTGVPVALTPPPTVGPC